MRNHHLSLCKQNRKPPKSFPQRQTNRSRSDASLTDNHGRNGISHRGEQRHTQAASRVTRRPQPGSCHTDYFSQESVRVWGKLWGTQAPRTDSARPRQGPCTSLRASPRPRVAKCPLRRAGACWAFPALRLGGSATASPPPGTARRPPEDPSSLVGARLGPQSSDPEPDTHPPTRPGPQSAPG